MTSYLILEKPYVQWQTDDSSFRKMTLGLSLKKMWKKRFFITKNNTPMTLVILICMCLDAWNFSTLWENIFLTRWIFNLSSYCLNIWNFVRPLKFVVWKDTALHKRNLNIWLQLNRYYIKKYSPPIRGKSERNVCTNLQCICLTSFNRHDL